MCRNFDRRILRNVTRRLFFAMLNQTVAASTPVSRAICFMISALVMFCKFLSDKGKQTFELKKTHRQSNDYTNRFIVLPQDGT